MTVHVLKNSPSLKNTMNRGMGFTEWRHEHTNYDNICSSLSNEEFQIQMKTWTYSLIRSLKNREHQHEVASWWVNHS